MATEELTQNYLNYTVKSVGCGKSMIYRIKNI